MSNVKKPRINPLSRLPRQQRLVMAVRGGAGRRQDALRPLDGRRRIGRLCIFDVERKSRLLKATHGLRRP